jgi:hypothetical protein
MEEPPAKRMKVVKSVKKAPTLPSLFLDVMTNQDIFDNFILLFIDSPASALFLSHTNKYFFNAIQRLSAFWYHALSHRENKRIKESVGYPIRSFSLTQQFFKGIPNEFRLSPVANFRPHDRIGYFSVGGRDLTWPIRQPTTEEYALLSEHSRKIVFLENCRTCYLCKHRHGLYKVWEMSKVVCDICFRDNLISNNDLFLEYGCLFWDIFKQSPEKFTNIFMFTVDVHTQNNRFLNGKYTWTHQKSRHFRRKQIIVNSPTIFFWKPHLSEQFNLLEERETNRKKQTASIFISAHVRALYTRLLIAYRGNPTAVLQKLVTGSLKFVSVSRPQVFQGVQQLLCGKPNLTDTNNPKIKQFSVSPSAARSQTIKTPGR